MAAEVPQAVLMAAEGAPEPAPQPQQIMCPPLEVLNASCAASDLQIVDGVTVVPPLAVYVMPEFVVPSQEPAVGARCRKCSGKGQVGLMKKKPCPVCEGQGTMPPPLWWETITRDSVQVGARPERSERLEDGTVPYTIEATVEDDDDVYALVAALNTNGAQGPPLLGLTIKGRQSRNQMNTEGVVGITDAGWGHVAQVLHTDPPALRSLRVFKIQNHALRPRACEVLSNAIAANLSVDELELWHCDINDVGAILLVQTLCTLRPLSLLNLGRNRIGGPTKIGLERLVEGQGIQLRVF